MFEENVDRHKHLLGGPELLAELSDELLKTLHDEVLHMPGMVSKYAAELRRRGKK